MLSVLGWDVVPNCTTAQCVEIIYKTKKIFAGAAGSVPNPLPSQGGSGGAPNHLAIHSDDNMGSFSRS